MSHMTHRQKQQAAKQQQMAADAKRIEWESRQYDKNKAYEQARRRQDAANDAGSTNNVATTLFGLLLFIAALLWLLQDDPDPTAIHCIGAYYQPVTTHNPADCRSTHGHFGSLK